MKRIIRTILSKGLTFIDNRCIWLHKYKPKLAKIIIAKSLNCRGRLWYRKPLTELPYPQIRLLGRVYGSLYIRMERSERIGNTSPHALRVFSNYTKEFIDEVNSKK